MTAGDAFDFIQQGGALAFALLIIWGLLTGQIVTKREMHAVLERLDRAEKLIADANSELQKQSSTNARLVELSFEQRLDTDKARRAPAVSQPTHPRRRETDQDG